MRIPIMKGVIDRRILVNYRVSPETLSRVLPGPFRPKLIDGFGIAGICLIRLKSMRPKGLPPLVGFGSENAAHRIAVEWEQDDQTHEGVYVPRRDTSSRLSSMAGGKIFPGKFYHARFQTCETASQFKVRMDSDDGSARVTVQCHLAKKLPSSSVFGSIERASKFFEDGSLGYSAQLTEGRYDGLELRTSNWSVEPLDVSAVESSFFEDEKSFPSGEVEFDCALLMRNIQHEWHSRDCI